MRLYNSLPVTDAWCSRGRDTTCGSPDCSGEIVGVRHGEGIMLVCSRTGARVGHVYDNMADVRREFAEFEASGVITPDGRTR